MECWDALLKVLNGPWWEQDKLVHVCRRDGSCCEGRTDIARKVCAQETRDNPKVFPGCVPHTTHTSLRQRVVVLRAARAFVFFRSGLGRVMFFLGARRKKKTKQLSALQHDRRWM